MLLARFAASLARANTRGQAIHVARMVFGADQSELQEAFLRELERAAAGTPGARIDMRTCPRAGWAVQEGPVGCFLGHVERRLQALQGVDVYKYV